MAVETKIRGFIVNILVILIIHPCCQLYTFTILGIRKERRQGAGVARPGGTPGTPGLRDQPPRFPGRGLPGTRRAGAGFWPPGALFGTPGTPGPGDRPAVPQGVPPGTG